jgi:hypothetical protein
LEGSIEDKFAGVTFLVIAGAGEHPDYLAQATQPCNSIVLPGGIFLSLRDLGLKAEQSNSSTPTDTAQQAVRYTRSDLVVGDFG